MAPSWGHFGVILGSFLGSTFVNLDAVLQRNVFSFASQLGPQMIHICVGILRDFFVGCHFGGQHL